MIKTLLTQKIMLLLEQQQSPCLSIFLPTHHKAGPELQQDSILLYNQLREAEQLLLARGVTREGLKAYQQPINRLLSQGEIWSHPQDGLALFCSSGTLYLHQLPYRVKEQTIVSDHFYVKPMLPLLMSESPFYLLALSQNEIRLFEATQFDIVEQDLPPSVPGSLAESFKGHQAGNDLEFHSSASSMTRGKGGRQPAIFHGQGIGIDDEKRRLHHFFQEVDRGLHQTFANQTAPLLLAGVEFLLPLYREANTYPHLLEEGITGNFDRHQGRDVSLHQQAWLLIEAIRQKDQQEALAHLEAKKGTDEVSCNVTEIVPATYEGRVKHLFLALNQEQWGTYKPATYTLQFHEMPQIGDDDLLEIAARQTLLHKGTVYPLKQEHMPGQAMLAAVYRY